MRHAYITVQMMRTLMNKKAGNNDDDDERLRILCEAVSEYVDKFCGRTFRVREGAQTYMPEWSDKVVVDDLLSVTSITTDMDGDGTFEETWSATDYFLYPVNALFNGRPYTSICRSLNGSKYIPNKEMRWPSFKVTGKWGFQEELESVAALNGGINASVTTIVSTVALEVGWTIKVDSEQMYVTDRDSTGLSLTVVRGVNGTTAASHLTAATIYVYRYPADIVQASMLHAGRIWRRKEAPTGIINTPGDIGWRAVYIPRFDSDTQAFLQPYRRRRVM